MAKKTETDVISLESENPQIAKPRLSKLFIKNFRCIGSEGIEIDLDDIVVLVGNNNSGKSSILKAYEIVMSHGSAKGKLNIDDFPNGQVLEDKLPEIRLETIVFDNTPGDRWVERLANGELRVKERWIWNNPGEPKREGWDVSVNEWSNNVPWGAPNIAKARRPQPHRIDAFASPDSQANEIKNLLIGILTERIKSLKESGQESTYSKLLETVKDFQKVVVAETKTEVQKIEQELSDAISNIFNDYKVLFDAKPEEDIDKSIVLFKAGAELLMGPDDGYLSRIENQGSGARRTLLWNALKILRDNEDRKSPSSRPHVLLFDEPEICLHPSAIRDACNVLYELPTKSNWQVMITTHSPIFIDISRDNTTIINVFINNSGEVKTTTVFRPSTVSLTTDDKQNIKLLNLYDPYVGEFFFGGTSIIVEGDTEYTAFKKIICDNQELYKNINIIRARGKATIISLIKILNHFGSNYSVLHDSDSPLDKNGNKSGTWTLNESILAEAKKIDSRFRNRVLCSFISFEPAYLGETIKTDKPYNILTKLSKDSSTYMTIERILQALIQFDVAPPSNCIEYNSIEELEQKYNALIQ